MKTASTADLLETTQPERTRGSAADEAGLPSGSRSHATPQSGDVQPSDSDPSGGGGGGLVRVTVNLTPKAYDALQRSGGFTGDSKTDTINRALLVYDLILQLSEQGGGHLTMVNRNGEKERIHIL